MKIKTRLILRHATAAEWAEQADFVPYDGEIVIYDADNSVSFARIKIGDGNTTIGNLPFLATGDGEGGSAIVNVSDLNNDVGYQTAEDVSQAISSAIGDVLGGEY